MSENIRTIDLSNDAVLADRDVASNVASQAIDVNQIDGTYAVVQPYDLDGGYNGSVVIYPQSKFSTTPITTLKTFNRVGGLNYPLDAKFDSLRRKIWIADTGHNRVLKINLNTNQADVNIDDTMEYPHALAVDLNTGNIFIKAYESYGHNRGVVFYYKRDGTLLSTFLFSDNDLTISSSSSSFGSGESSSSSNIFPPLPSNRSIVFDHVRSRVWWVDNVKIYMADIRNKQIQTYDVRDLGYLAVYSVNVEFKTGNALVVVDSDYSYKLLIQMNRDNNQFLGRAYIGI